MRRLVGFIALSVCLLTMAAAPSTAAGGAREDVRAQEVEARPWSADQPYVRRRLAAGAPLMVHVVVPLCHNEQINCGSGGLGSPGNLRTNLYWGALFGAKRIFARPDSGWEPVEQQTAVVGVLERAVYRRWVEGERWGFDDRRVEQLVVLDAVHGAFINSAVKRFYRSATQGGRLRIDDDGKRRDVPIAVAGYAGHNRLMDGMRLPAMGAPDTRRPVPSFVLACLSERFFAEPLSAAGSAPLVTTRSFMAPEGYVVEAAARALGDNRSPAAIRRAVVLAYARWQRIPERTAARVFR